MTAPTLGYGGVDVPAKFVLISGRINRLFVRPDPFSALLRSMQLHFAADRKQLVTSYPAGL